MGEECAGVHDCSPLDQETIGTGRSYCSLPDQTCRRLHRAPSLLWLRQSSHPLVGAAAVGLSGHLLQAHHSHELQCCHTSHLGFVGGVGSGFFAFPRSLSPSDDAGNIPEISPFYLADTCRSLMGMDRPLLATCYK